MVENIDIAKEIHAMSRMRFQSDFGFLNSVSYVKRYQSSICLSCVRSPLWFTMFTSLATGTYHFYELLDIFANGFWTCCQVIWYGLPWVSSIF